MVLRPERRHRTDPTRSETCGSSTPMDTVESARSIMQLNRDVRLAQGDMAAKPTASNPCLPSWVRQAGTCPGLQATSTCACSSGQVPGVPVSAQVRTGFAHRSSRQWRLCTLATPFGRGFVHWDRPDVYKLPPERPSQCASPHRILHAPRSDEDPERLGRSPQDSRIVQQSFYGCTQPHVTLDRGARRLIPHMRAGRSRARPQSWLRAGGSRRPLPDRAASSRCCPTACPSRARGSWRPRPPVSRAWPQG